MKRLDKSTGRWVDVKFQGERLIQARQTKGYCREDLSKRLLISNDELKDIESNKADPKDDVKNKICFLTGFPIDFFYKEIPEDIREFGELARKTLGISEEDKDY